MKLFHISLFCIHKVNTIGSIDVFYDNVNAHTSWKTKGSQSIYIHGFVYFTMHTMCINSL